MLRSRSRPALHMPNPWVLAVLLFAFTAALFGRAAFNGYVNYDDDVYVYANSHITRGLTVPGIVRAFTGTHARNWHPLTTITHMADCQIFGMNPAGPHAINVLLHALAVGGLFLFLHMATGSTWRAAVTAALWAVHPLRVESVAWISERKDVLSAVLFMATLLAYEGYARAPRVRQMLVVAGVFAAGLMAKPMLVTLPCVLLLIDYWPLRRLRAAGGALPLVRALSEKAPLFVMAACSAALTVWAQHESHRAVDPIPLVNRLANAALSYCTYIYQLIWPDRLAVFYPLPVQPEQGVAAAAAGIILLCGSAGAFVFRKRFPYFFAGWFWYVIMLVPVIGIWPNGQQAHADRYTYLPHIGLLFVFVWGAMELLRRARALRLAVPIATALALLCAWQTWQLLAVWHDSETLWRRAIAVTSDNDVALNNLGQALQARGDLDGALGNFRAALEILHRRTEEHLGRALLLNNIGNNFVRRNQLEEAIANYRQSIAARPDFGNVRVNLAEALVQKRDWNGALSEYEQAIRLQPQDADAQHRAGNVALRLGQVERAIGYYKKALEIEPRFSEAAVDLGNALASEGRVDEAVECYRRAIESDAGNADAHFNLGHIYLGERRTAEAVKELQRVVSIAPSDAEAHNNLANAYAMEGAEKSAVGEYEKAVQLAPESVSVLNNFAWLLVTARDGTLRDPPRALSLAEKAERAAPEPQALIYHTLAAAYAAVGRTEEAIAAAERAEHLAQTQGDTKLAQSVQRELESYKTSAGR